MGYTVGGRLRIGCKGFLDIDRERQVTGKDRAIFSLSGW